MGEKDLPRKKKMRSLSLRLFDKEYFFRFVRMTPQRFRFVRMTPQRFRFVRTTPQRFEHLLSLVGPQVF